MRNFIRVTLFSVFLICGCGKEKPKQEPMRQPSVAPETTQTYVEEPASEDTMKKEPKAPIESKGKPVIERSVAVIGDVVDIVSYATTGVMGNSPDGKEIIKAGAKGGNPLGILESKTGNLYIVTMKQANTSANASLLPFVGIHVTAKGDVYRKGDQRLLVLSVIGKSAD